MVMKARVFYLMQYLEQNSDEQHSVTTAEIHRAIGNDWRITFKYTRHNIDKQQVSKYTGTQEEDCVCSPYTTIWNNERYYPVG